MHKAGWQVTCGILSIALVGAGFALAANKRALEQATEDLKAARTVETVTVHEVHRQACPESAAAKQFEAGDVVPWPEGARCMGGRLLSKTATGWESVTHGGKAVLCRE